MCTAKKMEARLLCRHGSTKLSKYFVTIISENDDIEIKTKLQYENHIKYVRTPRSSEQLVMTSMASLRAGM